jgi:hypothetical protein
VAWWLILLIVAAVAIRRIFTGNPDCFYQFGSYDVCDATQRLSIYISLFLLMTQALISRILVPGRSNFVNASVRLLFPAPQHCLLRDASITIFAMTFASDFIQRRNQ